MPTIPLGEDNDEEGLLEPQFTRDKESGSEAEWYNDQYDIVSE